MRRAVRRNYGTKRSNPHNVLQGECDKGEFIARCGENEDSVPTIDWNGAVNDATREILLRIGFICPLLSRSLPLERPNDGEVGRRAGGGLGTDPPRPRDELGLNLNTFSLYWANKSCLTLLLLIINRQIRAIDSRYWCRRPLQPRLHRASHQNGPWRHRLGSPRPNFICSPDWSYPHPCPQPRARALGGHGPLPRRSR